MDRYNSVNNTKNDFRIAFWKLYERNPVEKISVSELCRVAGYNRTTFYVYYDNIYDLLHRCIEEMIRPLETHLGGLQRFCAKEDKGVLERLYMTILKTNEKRIRLLIERHQLYILENRVKELIKPILYAMHDGSTLSSCDLDYILEYELAAVFGVIAKWFRDQDMTDQEIICLLIDCSQTGVINLLNENNVVEDSEIRAAQDKAILDKIIEELEAQKE
ncbi:MAG: hypothetical protein K6B12_03355 [Clostridiales bacterium]|nr:hypothetical protein [Clostridiales bacterium]